MHEAVGWLAQLPKPVAAEDELAVVDQLDYLGADDEDEKRERQFWKSVTINPPYYGADTP